MNKGAAYKEEAAGETSSTDSGWWWLTVLCWNICYRSRGLCIRYRERFL